MAKKITALIKLALPAGKATPAPPVGPALGAKGVNIMDFCKQFNGRTQDKQGKLLPVVIDPFAPKVVFPFMSTVLAKVDIPVAFRVPTLTPLVVV